MRLQPCLFLLGALRLNSEVYELFGIQIIVSVL